MLASKLVKNIAGVIPPTNEKRIFKNDWHGGAQYDQIPKNWPKPQKLNSVIPWAIFKGASPARRRRKGVKGNGRALTP